MDKSLREYFWTHTPVTDESYNNFLGYFNATLLEGGNLQLQMTF